MKKNNNIKTIIEKLNEKQLRCFVKYLNDEQIRTLFNLKAWTYDELRNLFASMKDFDSGWFFENLTPGQLLFLLEIMTEEEDEKS